jgi:hypothetical protein
MYVSKRFNDFYSTLSEEEKIEASKAVLVLCGSREEEACYTNRGVHRDQLRSMMMNTSKRRLDFTSSLLFCINSKDSM